jgi:hypothetical protein
MVDPKVSYDALGRAQPGQPKSETHNATQAGGEQIGFFPDPGLDLSPSHGSESGKPHRPGQCK